MENRLRLVASQVKAGNDNPKIILELNELYEKWYNIPNALWDKNQLNYLKI
jgi:hypothetical protein